MKEKVIAFVLAGMMVLSLTACGERNDPQGSVNAGNGDVTTDNGGNTGNSGTSGSNGSSENSGGTVGGESGTVPGNAKGRTWDTDTRSGVQDNFDNNHGSTFGGVDRDSVYDDMTGYRTNSTATWQQMLENGRVHDTDGYLLDGENTTW